MAGDDRNRTLGDHFRLQRGTTYKSRLLGQPGPVLLGLASIQRNGGFRRDSLRTYGGESPEKLIVRPGELYLSLKDVTQSADLLGAVARLPVDHAPGRLTQDTVKLEPRRGDAPLGYLYWLLRTPQFRSYCRAHATGTTNLGLAREDFLAFPAPDPSAEQLRIVDLLDALDDKIELNRRMNETLEAMARALFKSWFVDFDPVRAKAQGQPPPGMDPATAALFSSELQDSELGEIPKGWRVSTLKDETTKIGSGATPRGGKAAYLDDGIALIRSQNVYDSQFVWDGLARISEEAASKLDGVTVEPDDVLLNITGASILRTCVVEPDVLPARVNQHVAIVRARTGVPARYVHFHLLNPRTKDYLMGMDAGASRQAVTKAHIESVPIIIPSSPVLARFDEFARPLFWRVSLNNAQSRILAETRDALLPRLLSGELSVAQAEQTVEATA